MNTSPPGKRPTGEERQACLDEDGQIVRWYDESATLTNEQIASVLGGRGDATVMNLNEAIDHEIARAAMREAPYPADVAAINARLVEESAALKVAQDAWLVEKDSDPM